MLYFLLNVGNSCHIVLKGFKWDFSGNLPGFCWKNVGLTFSHFCTCTLKNACTEKALEVMQ